MCLIQQANFISKLFNLIVFIVINQLQTNSLKNTKQHKRKQHNTSKEISQVLRTNQQGSSTNWKSWVASGSAAHTTLPLLSGVHFAPTIAQLFVCRTNVGTN